jgi:hypothetical protein
MNAPLNFVLSTCLVLVNLISLKGEVTGIPKLPAAKIFLNTRWYPKYSGLVPPSIQQLW